MQRKICLFAALITFWLNLFALCTHKNRIFSSSSSDMSSSIRMVLEPLPAPNTRTIPQTIFSGKYQSISYSIDHYLFLPDKLDLNTADESLLQTIKGIGPSAAVRIVLERSQRGRFLDVDDFIRRTGVRREDIEAVRKWIYVGDC
ncbi:helix-hairpin-helix domain-containing protein [bacterium]|nr:helix-hairpin-helix domain-containing protein [candidate division CSSED10-310 bacterium]